MPNMNIRIYIRKSEASEDLFNSMGRLQWLRIELTSYEGRTFEYIDELKENQSFISLINELNTGDVILIWSLDDISTYERFLLFSLIINREINILCFCETESYVYRMLKDTVNNFYNYVSENKHKWID